MSTSSEPTTEIPEGLDPAAIARLFQLRWSVPAVVALHELGGGAKLITVVNRLGTGRESVVRTLGRLVEEGWVARNPGYGHPLRPEYVLTAGGKRLAPRAKRLLDALDEIDARDVGLRKWSLGIVAAIAGGCSRHSEIRAQLPVTARAMSLAFKNLGDAGLVERVVYDSVPPEVVYRLTPRGAGLVGGLRAVGRLL